MEEKQYLTTEEASKFLGELGFKVSPITLAIWRSGKKRACPELPYYKISKWVHYKREDLIAFVESRRFGGSPNE